MSDTIRKTAQAPVPTIAQPPAPRSAGKELAKDIGFECLGSLLLAVTTYNVALQAEFPMTGLSGIALILYRLFRLPIGWMIIFLNIPLAILCGRLIGRRFLVKSLRCMVISSLLLDYFAPLLPVFHGDRMIAALVTGAVGGVGYAMIYVRGSSTGGSDFIVMAVKRVKPHLNLGTIVFLTDLLIILAGGLIFRDLEGIVYGLIIDFMYATVADRVLLGLNSGKVALIVADRGKGKRICEEVALCCGRGSTILSAMGGYHCEGKDVVMVAGNNKDMYQIQKRIREVDPGSFTIILESYEVQGEGFQITRVAGG